MKADDKDIRWIEEPRLGLSGKTYLPLVLDGMRTTLRHLLSRKITLQSPEERHQSPDPLIYRGVHRLNRDAQGRVSSVPPPARRIASTSWRPRAPGRTGRNTPKALRSTSCGVFFAGCAKRLARWTPSS
jgi:hypothetical protein